MVLLNITFVINGNMFISNTNENNRRLTSFIIEYERFLYVVLILCLYICSFIFHIYEIYGHDFWEHASSIQSFKANLLNPKHPIINEYLPHPFLNPYTLFLALISFALKFTSVETLSIFSMINLTLLLKVSWIFFKNFYSDQGLLRAHFIFLLLVLFGWTKPPVWSGFLNFESLFFTLAYPSTLSIILALYSANLFIKITEDKDNFISTIAIIICNTLILLCHSISFLFLVLLIAFILFSKNVTKFKYYFTLFFVTSIPFLLVQFWPYFDFYKLYLDINILRVSNTLR